jgi:WD40 repeat protein
MDNKALLRTIRQEYVQGVCFSPRGVLVAAGIGGPVRLYDPSNGVEIRHIGDLPEPHEYMCVAFAQNGEWLATGGADGVVRLWDAESGRELRAFPHRFSVTSVAFSHDNSLLASSSEDPVVLLWSCP